MGSAFSLKNFPIKVLIGCDERQIEYMELIGQEKGKARWRGRERKRGRESA